MKLPNISNCLILPHYPIGNEGWPYETWIGDFPPTKPRPYDKGWADFIEKKFPKISDSTSSIFKKEENWQDLGEKGLKFTLEVVGYGKEHLSIEIKNSALSISAKNGAKSFNKSFSIPQPETLDLNGANAKVEHGLLEITIPEKKVEVKTIKVL